MNTKKMHYVTIVETCKRKIIVPAHDVNEAIELAKDDLAEWEGAGIEQCNIDVLSVEMMG